MIDPTYPLRIATLLGSTVSGMLVSDPWDFLQKLRERVRQSPQLRRIVPRRALKKPGMRAPSPGRALIQQGELTAGVLKIRRATGRIPALERGFARQAQDKADYLKGLPTPTRAASDQSGPQTVLHVLTNSRPFTESGYTLRSHHVLKCQNEAGLRVSAVTRLGYPVVIGKIPLRPVQTIDGIRYRRLLPWIYPLRMKLREKKAVRQVVNEARELGVTVIHTTTDYTNARVAAAAAAELGVPWVYEVRGELESTWLSRHAPEDQERARRSEFFQLARTQEAHCMKAASAVVALSEVSKADLVGRGIDPGKISVVPNAFDSSLLVREYDRDAVRAELGLPGGKRLLGTVTAVVGYEGLDTIIDAIAALPPEWEAVIVGDGEDLPRLQQLAQDAGVSRRVHFVGRKPSDSIWKWYASLDVFAVPRVDTHVTRAVTPIKPLIAMALGIPVVASDLPALREVTGGYASYAQAGNIPEFVECVTSAAQQTPAPRAWLESRTWSENGRRYRQIYQNL